MNIDVRSQRDREAPVVVEFAEEHVFAALMRFADQVVSARLRLTDLNGPRGGVDTRCVIFVSLTDGSQWFAAATSDSVHEAIDVAARRIRRQVSRHFDRLRETRRGLRSPLEQLDERLREISLA